MYTWVFDGILVHESTFNFSWHPLFFFLCDFKTTISFSFSVQESTLRFSWSFLFFLYIFLGDFNLPLFFSFVVMIQRCVFLIFFNVLFSFSCDFIFPFSVSFEPFLISLIVPILPFFNDFNFPLSFSFGFKGQRCVFLISFYFLYIFLCNLNFPLSFSFWVHYSTLIFRNVLTVIILLASFPLSLSLQRGG